MTTSSARLAILDALAAGPLTLAELVLAAGDPGDPEEPWATGGELASCQIEGLAVAGPGDPPTYRLTAAGRAGWRNCPQPGGVP